MQHLLARAVWDEDGVRDDVRDYVVEHLGDPQAVLVVDETGDLKKGTRTVGVQRQYTGTAGRVENAQVAVLLAYATDAGARRDRPGTVRPPGLDRRPRPLPGGGHPRPGRVRDQAQAGHNHAHPCAGRRDAGRVGGSGDEVYGADPTLRACLEARSIGYVLAVACDHPVQAGGKAWRADALRKRVPARAWQCVSAGRGAKGHRYYDWAFIRLDPSDPARGGQHWLMIRRNRSSGELAYYRCWMPHPVPLAVLVRVAGRRWSIEERIKTSKGLVGLDAHQVRRWRSWYRWATLAMLAHAFLVIAALTQHTRHPPPSELIGLTCNELHHLVAALLAVPVADPAHRVRWSVWRRRQQARARTCHYRRQANGP